MTERKNKVRLMVRSMARSGALASAIVGVALCEALVCQPARALVCQPEAGYYAFGCTEGHVVTLDLLEGSTWVPVAADGVQGWISTRSAGIGGPTSTNTNYAVGYSDGVFYNDYFGFNLDAVNVTVTAAKLEVYSGTITNNLEYDLFAATGLLAEMEEGSPNTGLYESMMLGTPYGSSLLHATNASNPMSTLIFTLDSSAVNEINEIKGQGMFGIAGHVDPPPPVPEPSTWVMIVAGFVGLGVVGRRRAARRRVAAPAG
jgi:PEP-CTERM motif